MKKQLFSIVAIGSIFLMVRLSLGQSSKNMVLADFISSATLYGRTVNFTNEGPVADVWGWTYQGKEYALVCLRSNHVINNWDGTTYLSGEELPISFFK